MGEGEVHNEHGQQVGFARIKAALEDLQCGDFGHGNAQGLRSQLTQGRLRVRRGQSVFVGFAGGIGCTAHFDRKGREGQFEFRNTDHGQPLWLVVIKQVGLIIAVQGRPAIIQG